MQGKKPIITAAIISASLGFCMQPTFAQSTPGGPSMPGGPAQPGPGIQQPGPQTQPTIPGKPAPTPGLPQTDPIPGQPGTIPERMDHPRAGTEQNMVITSAEIRKAQEALKAKGHNPGTDGKMDAQTQQALRDFQKANNLPATGVLDEKTADRLGVMVEKGNKSSAPSALPRETGKSGAPSASPAVPRTPVQ